MALGELGLMPNEFWTLTNGELSAKFRGFSVNRDLRSSDHRNVFGLLHNVNAAKKDQKKPYDLWPLDIDEIDRMDIDERLELYGKIIKNSVN